ncbi:Uncharacterised protein [Vibrio cholerae]|uniref:Uncharacterized protein n=1 Tax=Vibrio cholerae TaxID=666 RepID=A0A655YKT4_VIBCL|nr:Uncharacterised protein [Vibrio cholerae]
MRGFPACIMVIMTLPIFIDAPIKHCIKPSVMVVTVAVSIANPQNKLHLASLILFLFVFVKND